MENTARFSRILFALPWFVFALQHFIYAGFVTNIVPAYMPMRSFWVYFTGTAMCAAAISLIINKKSALAAFLLGVMVMGFILMIHTIVIAGNPNARNWTRMLQDLAISVAAFVLAGSLSKGGSENDIFKTIAKIGRYVFAVILIIFGVQHFLNLEFMTANVPAYLPLQMIWMYLVGITLIITGLSILANKKARLTATIAGVLLLIVNLLFHAPLLAKDPKIGGDWTAAMIDLAITGGVFILASTATED